MANADPLLVVQMHRMGDLILTFPLLEELQRQWPTQPVYVLAKREFFAPLLPLAPDVRFFSLADRDFLLRQHYALAINLSTTSEAVECFGHIQAEQKLGPELQKDVLRVKGFWHLYRLSLTHNNRHNLFHWADLYRLDLQKQARLQNILPHLPQGHGTRKVGLVLGASEEAKRPTINFWVDLVAQLLRAEIEPCFLGGTQERELGQTVARRTNLPQANFCGFLSLSDLASLLSTLDLCITPDTGPMHLANRLGVPVLNLSMGSVNAWETGPLTSGQWVLKAKMSCTGCWQCHAPQLYCKQKFSVTGVFNIVQTLLEAREPVREIETQGLELFQTKRDPLGLYTLRRICATERKTARELLDAFWQAVFLSFYDTSCKQLVAQRKADLAQHYPLMAQFLQIRVTKFLHFCLQNFKKDLNYFLISDFWRNYPPALRLLAGYVQMFLQNNDYDKQSRALLLEQLATLL